MLLQEYISLEFVLYLSSGDIHAIAVFRFCRIPRCFPFGKLLLTFLTLVIGENIRQQNSGDIFKLVLRNGTVVDELLSPAQAAPPKKYFAASFSHTAEEWCLERLLSFAFLFSLHPPFLIKNKNATACQAFQPVCVCMVSCIFINEFIKFNLICQAVNSGRADIVSGA